VNERLRATTRIALIFAAASILLFHGFNAYAYWADRKSAPPPAAPG
jgi:hypothetical protein